jgi:hypothetical protein
MMPTSNYRPPDPTAEYRRVLEADSALLVAAETIRNSEYATNQRATPTELPSQRYLGSIERKWPKPPAEQAFSGIVGEIVRTIEPHTEADPSALLFQLLVGFGNLIGRGPFVIADGARHGCNLFIAIVGVSSKGRKGTALSHVLRVLEAIDSQWARTRIQGGLSSGEGLIWGVRDPIEKLEAVREKKRVVEYQTVVNDSGVSDKRLLIVETEFAATLRVMAREGSTLGTTIRQAWDTGDLRVLTKNSPAQATGAHISIVGHITRDELLRHLTSTDIANGFANRFLFTCSRRSKLLPEGGDIQSVDFAPLLGRLAEVASAARNTGEIRLDDGARKIWREVYPTLSEGRPGLLGSVTGRSEAQVLRLSLVYALLDGATVISTPHMLAALAAWDYSEASAQFIFGDSLGYPEADRILAALRGVPGGLTRTEIRDLFNRNQREPVIEGALTSLEERGLARRAIIQTGGRPTERWISGTPTTPKTT